MWLHTIVILIGVAVIAAFAVTPIKELIMAKTDEIVTQLTNVAQTLDRVKTDTGRLLADIAALQDQIANADVPQEIADAVAALGVQAQAIDDLVQDPTTPPAPVEPPQPQS